MGHTFMESRGDRSASRDDRDELHLLNHALHDLIDLLKHDSWPSRPDHGVVTKCDLDRMEERIMSAISDWNAKVGPKLDRIQTGLDAVQALVEKLQNSPGAITPEDQALLDQIEQKVDAIASDADSVPTPPVA